MNRILGDYPPALGFADKASGVIAASISSLHDSYIMWFRPEVIITAKWGGDPRKSAEQNDGGLSPRNSFELWKETVKLCAKPTLASEIDSARDLRETIVRIVLRSAEEMAALNVEPTRSNQELEAFSYSARTICRRHSGTLRGSPNFFASARRIACRMRANATSARLSNRRVSPPRSWIIC